MQKASQITQNSLEEPADPHACLINNAFEATVCIKRPARNTDFSFLKLEPKLVIASHDPASGTTLAHIDPSDDELSELVKLFTHPDVLKMLPKETLLEIAQRFAHPDVLNLTA